MIIKYKPNFILNAGGIGENINIGDVVVARSVIQHDFDVSDFTNKNKGEIPGLDVVQMLCSPWIAEKILN